MGLSFNFDEMKPTNTLMRIVFEIRKDQGKEKDYGKTTFAYFTESRNLSDVDTLVTIAEASGLDKQEALKVINDKSAYANDVRVDEAIAQQYQISGVPYFIINQKYAISGAQPLETFVGALQQVWEEENPVPKLQELSQKEAICLVQMKAVRYLKRTIVFMMEQPIEYYMGCLYSYRRDM